MSKVTITLDNGAGALSTVMVEETEAKQALLDMIEELGDVNAGDTFSVQYVEDE